MMFSHMPPDCAGDVTLLLRHWVELESAWVPVHDRILCNGRGNTSESHGCGQVCALSGRGESASVGREEEYPKFRCELVELGAFPNMGAAAGQPSHRLLTEPASGRQQRR